MLYRTTFSEKLSGYVVTSQESELSAECKIVSKAFSTHEEADQVREKLEEQNED